jgi:predicted GTPase
MRNVLILGAAGRDFHNFNVYYRNNLRYNVVGFTATQIPGIGGRVYPKQLAGDRYPKGIPIFEEKDLEKLIAKLKVDECVFSYSDVAHEYVMHLASRSIAAGASFVLLGPKDSMLKSTKKVLAICATRTGAGKSPLTREVCRILKERGIRYAVVRHPMPYGQLEKQAVERFEKLEDMDAYKCTIEEREEYEAHIRNGSIVYAGVDYQRILWNAENEAEVVIWDGGNNDIPFFKPDLHIVVADALRAGHELKYHPGEANFRMADLLVVNKVGENPAGAKQIKEDAKIANPKAKIIESDMVLTPEYEGGALSLKGKRALIIEDGPTVTHGGMGYGAGYAYAKKCGVKIVDPREHAVGSIKQAYVKYPHLKDVLPALGYSDAQVKELGKSVNRSDAEVIITGTPIDLRHSIKTKKPMVHIRYEFKERGKGNELKKTLVMWLGRL